MKSCRSSAGSLIVTAGIAFAAGILTAVFLPNIIIIVILTIMMVILCISLLK